MEEIQTYDMPMANISIKYIVNGYPIINNVDVIISSENKIDADNLPDGFMKLSDYQIKKSYITNNEEEVTLYIYSGSSDKSIFSQKVSINVIQIGGFNSTSNSDIEVYGFTDSKEAIKVVQAKVKEETIMIPFTFKVEKKNNGVFNETIIEKTINIPCTYAKNGNNIVLASEFKVSYEEDNNFKYLYFNSEKSIHLIIPISYIGTSYRWVAITENVPEKYKMWDYINDDYPNMQTYQINNRGSEEYDWIWIRLYRNKIILYSTRNEATSFSFAKNYSGANTD